MIQNLFNVIKGNFILKVMMGILAVCFSYYFIGCGVARAEDLSHPVGFDYDPERIVVKFTGSPQFNKFSYETPPEYIKPEILLVKIKEGQNINDVIDEYRQRDEVEYVQPDYKRYACDFNEGVLAPANWGIIRTGANVLSQRVIGNNIATVALVDSGVETEHPFLSGKVIAGYDFVEEDDIPNDGSGHGTHLAGIISMVAGHQRVRIMPLRVLDAKGEGYDSDIAQAIFYAADRGADVINLSLGGPGQSPLLEDAINYAVGKGVVVVCAAGNSAADASNYTPAGIENCLTVSAVDQSDEITTFSNYGPVIDVAAPGKDIPSSVPLIADCDGILDGYTEYDGTSVAAPFVSGVAALLRVNDASISVTQISEMIYKYCDDVGVSEKDDYYGHGILNFYDYTNDLLLTIKIITPTPANEYYESLNLSYQIEGNFSGYARFIIDKRYSGSQKVNSPGVLEYIFNVQNLADGEHDLTIELIDNLGNVITTQKTSFLIATPFYNLLEEFSYLNDGMDKTIDPQHVFTIGFSLTVDEASVSGNSLQLYCLETGQKVPVIINRKDERTYNISPEEPLSSGCRYCVVVRPAIRSQRGDYLKEGVLAKFVVPGIPK